MNFQFKVPETIPQDILLIRDIVGDISASKAHTQKDVRESIDSSDDSIASSSSEIDSEEEVEAGLLVPDEQPSTCVPIIPESPGAVLDSDSSSESDEDEDETGEQTGEKITLDSRKLQIDVDDDEESGAVTSYMHTKNEVVEADVIVPSVSEIGPEESLEKIGEVLNIVGNVVIVKGLPADPSKAASEKALDTETLLVFDDRKVLGHIYETFGPTSQPLYQIKFNQIYPLDTEKIRVAREVYHVPQRSHFVFLDYLKKLRGSDASNIHDEEPGEDEIEFSDDEREAAFKQARKKKRGASISSSRQTTPAPSQTHHNDISEDIFYGANPYDAHGPYDDGYGVAGPSRPAPIPYDDPYADEVEMDNPKHEWDLINPSKRSAEARPTDREPERKFKDSRGRGRGRGRGYDRGGGARDHGRGHIRGRGRPDRGRHSEGESRWVQQNHTAVEPYNPNNPGTLPPISDTIQRAAAQLSFAVPGYPSSQLFSPSPTWPYPQGGFQGHSLGQQEAVQPHINPRFASVFGLNIDSTNHPPAWFGNQQTQFDSYQTPQPPRTWTNQWVVHEQEPENAESGAYSPV